MLPAASGGTISLAAMATATSEPTDPELEQAAWDLDALVEGAGDAGVERQLDEALTARAGLRRALRRQGRRARRSGPGGGDARAGRDSGLDRAARARMPPCASRPTPPTRPAARCCSACRSGARRSRRTLLFFELEWAALDDGAGRGAAGRRRAGLRAPPPAHRAPLPRRTCSPSPRRRSSPRRRVTGRGAWARLFEEQTVGDRGGAADERARPRRAGGRARAACPRPTASVRRDAAEAGDRRRCSPGCARARYIVQHAAGGQGGRRPPAPLPALAGGAQPRQRGQRRVRARR